MTNESLAGKPQDVDRTGWPKGPWDDEPDRLDWKTDAGFLAIALRHTSGHWCGYVAVPPGHPLFPSEDHGDEARYHDIEVHGGVTYCGMCQGHVCHIPGPGEPAEVFWIGFDFAHSRDASPNRFDVAEGWTRWEKDGRIAYWGPQAQFCRGEIKGHYRDLAYVKAECEEVGRQLAAMAAS